MKILFYQFVLIFNKDPMLFLTSANKFSKGHITHNVNISPMSQSLRLKLTTVSFLGKFTINIPFSWRMFSIFVHSVINKR